MKHAIISVTKDGVASRQVAKQRTVSSPKASSGSDETLTKVMKMVQEWLDYRKKLLPKWERDIKLYNNERVQRKFEGVSDTFVPMTFSTIETITSAIATGDLSTDFLPQDIYKYLKDRLMTGYTGVTQDEGGNEVQETEDEFMVRAMRNAIMGGIIDDESLKVVNGLYDYYWERGDWVLRFESLVKSGLKIGNGSWWLAWKDSRPDLVFVPFPDFIFDPKASNDDECRFMGRRYLASLEELKKETIINPTTGKPQKRYKLKGVTKSSLTQPEDKTDKQLKEDMLFGSTVSAEDSDQVEVIELFYKDRMCTIINRKIVAEDEENFIITQANLRGIPTDELITKIGISWANYRDESLYIGKSETETFWQEQERLNDATNQKSDAVTRALLQNYRADPGLKSQSKSFGIPGSVIWGTPNQYEAIPPAIVPNVAFNEEASIKNNIRETTATDQIVKGVGGQKNVTATEANLQVAQSGQRIDNKVESLVRGPLKRLARLTLQYIRLFITDPFIIPVREGNGMSVLLFDPNKHGYIYEPKVSLTLSAQSKRKQEQSEARETYQVLISDPTNNLPAVKKIMLPKMVDLDKDEIGQIIESVQPPVPPEMAEMAGEAPQGEAMPSMPGGAPQGMPMSPEVAL